MEKIEISANEVSKRIYTLRGCQVMLDSDLAEIYEVETRILNEALKRNIKRFPGDFMFKITKEELEGLRSQSAISNLENHFEVGTKPVLRSQFAISSFKKPLRQRGGNRYLPSAFTESGVGMLSSVLHSQKAVQVNIEIIRAFVQLRKQAKINTGSLESKVDMIIQRLDRFENRLHSPIEHDPIDTIQSAVARRWGLATEDLKSSARKRGISLPRQIAIYLVRNQMGISFSEIGQHFGRRDHSTILHAYRKIEAALGVNDMIQESIHALQHIIKRETGFEPATLSLGSLRSTN